MKVHCVSPVLQVGDLNRSLAFNVDVLGFSKEFMYGEPPYYAGVKRDEIVLHLNSIPENQARRGMGSAYLFCSGVDGYFQEVKTRGAEITSPLATYPYGMRDFQVKDPDGNLVCFGQSVESDK